jgi:hypothetical protein
MFKKVQQVILVIILSVILIYGFYLFLQMRQEIQLLFLSGIGWIIGQMFLKRKEIQMQHISQKSDAYEKFMFDFYKIMETVKTDAGSNVSQSAVEDMKAFKIKVLLWGNSGMIKKFLIFERNSINNTSTKNAIINMNNFMHMIREDLGHDDSSLKNYELARMVIKAEEFDKINNCINSE